MSSDDFVRRLAGGLIISCAAVFIATVGALAMPGVRAKLGFASATPVSYEVGSRIDLPALVYESSPYTVVLFARSSCGVCQAAKPLFGRLVADLKSASTTRVVLVVGTTSRHDEEKYAKELGLSETQLLRLDLKSLRLRRVPTVVALDERGIVLFSREGAPLPTEQEQFLQTVMSLIPAR